MNISRSIAYGLILTIMLTLIFTIPGEKGLIQAYRLHKEHTDLLADNASLEADTASLTREAYMLRENKAYIEHVIIQEMNLVKPHDIIVVFKKEKK